MLHRAQSPRQLTLASRDRGADDLLGTDMNDHAGAGPSAEHAVDPPRLGGEEVLSPRDPSTSKKVIRDWRHEKTTYKGF